MGLLKRYTTVGFLCILFFLSGYKNAIFASMKASSQYSIIVDVTDKGETQFSSNIKLTNESNDYFIRDYTIVTDYDDLSEFQVFENGGQGVFTREYRDNKVRIKILLKNPLLKNGDTVNLFVSYRTQQSFKKEGGLYKLRIPQLKTEENSTNSQYTIKIPDTFGPLSFNSLKKSNVTVEDGKHVITYTESDAPLGALFLVGQSQQFEFTYQYELSNDTNRIEKYSVTLPPESPSQKLYFYDNDLGADRTFHDLDGNFLLEYFVDPQNKKSIRIVGLSQFSYNHETITIDAGGIQSYLESSDIWDFTNSDIQSLIPNIVKPDNSQYDNAQLINDYIVSTYDYSGSESPVRKKSSDLVKDKQNFSCINFADLFVSLTRGAGLPSREVIGYSAFSQSLDTVHYWAEFYDESKKEWIAADPCFEDAFSFHEFDTLDPHRMILAYWGVTDTRPDIVIPFTQFQEASVANLELKLSSNIPPEEKGDILMDSSVSNIDLFLRNAIVSVSVTNNSHSIYVFDEITIDGKIVELASNHSVNTWKEAVAPGQTKNFLVPLSKQDDIDISRSSIHSMEVKGHLGRDSLVKELEFKINRPFSLIHLAIWFGAFFLAFITLIGLLLLTKKTRKEMKKIKKIRRLKKESIPRLRKSNLRGFTGVPVSLT
jgi:transglutaminase-like putative cysteine protease